jgi:DNA-directed RNA polymerase subunit M/transcription elongation factor TFIIS/DNA-directed RNA polymerase subunit RPC12/RpoP
MNLRCADCGTTFLLTPDGMTQTAACPNCGGTRLERDQPSPTKSDGELRNMVDPATQLDQGGNPLQEGVWATVDGGWQPRGRRDESFASVRTAESDFGGDWDFGLPEEPTHAVVIGPNGRVYSKPYGTGVTHFDIANEHGLPDFPKGYSMGHLMPGGEVDFVQHDSGHDANALSGLLGRHFGQPVMVSPDLKPTTNEERWFNQDTRGVGNLPFNPYSERIQDRQLEQQMLTPDKRQQMLDAEKTRGKPFGFYNNPYINRGGSVMERTLNMEPYVPWTHQADLEEPMPTQDAGPQHTATVTPGPYGIHAGTCKWLGFLDAHVNGKPARQHMAEITQEHGDPQHPNFRQPVQVAVHDPAHLPAAVEAIEQSVFAKKPNPQLVQLARAIKTGQVAPPPGINPASITANTHEAGFLAPLIPAAAGALGLGAGEAAGGGLLSMALPKLMQGAMFGTGSNLAKGLLGGGGGQDQNAAGAMPSMPPRDVGVLGAVVEMMREADLETPHTTPFLHDNPDGDTRQYGDGDMSPDFQNPNINSEAGGAANGEDNVPGGIGQDQPSMNTFADDSPGVERAKMLGPMLMHYFHSEESAANDPILRALHEQLESENPGYLDRVGPEHEDAMERLLQSMKEPQGVHAHLHEAAPVYQNTELAPGQQSMFPGGQGQVNQGVFPGTMQTQGRCPYCGSVTTADGSCPQCGAKTDPMGGANPPAQGPGMGPGMGVAQPSMPPDNRIQQFGAYHQGPVTKEQIAAVQNFLIQQGRVEEVPNVVIEPWNYADILAQLTNQGDVPENVDPNEQAPPAPAQEVAPPGATMPMPNPADPSMQGMMPTGSVIAADSVTERCPNCNSATTGLLGQQGDGTTAARCHACGNVWKLPNTFREKVGADDQSSPNVVGVPAADQDEPDPGVQDTTHSWQDANGTPLAEGQTYEMHSPNYAVPDIVRVEQIKPDAIVVSTIGEYSPAGDTEDANPLSYTHEIPLEEVKLEGLTFEPSTDQAGDQSLQEYQDRGQAPVNTEPVQETGMDPRMTHVTKLLEAGFEFDEAKGVTEWMAANNVTDLFDPRVSKVLAQIKQHREVAQEAEEKGVEYTPHEAASDNCPRCDEAHHMSSVMSSPTSIFHECYRCGHTWETKEEDYIDEHTAHRAWLLTDSGPGGDDFWAGYERARAGGNQGMSRNLGDIASRDSRYQAVKEHLDAAKMEREAGKKFTPREQREFIEEQGVARNADRLDLTGTHYESHRYLGDRVNPDNAPDEHLFMGM